MEPYIQLKYFFIDILNNNWDSYRYYTSYSIYMYIYSKYIWYYLRNLDMIYYGNRVSMKKELINFILHVNTYLSVSLHIKIVGICFEKRALNYGLKSREIWKIIIYRGNITGSPRNWFYKDTDLTVKWYCFISYIIVTINNKLYIIV